METSRLTQPLSIDDLLVYRLIRLGTLAGTPTVRICEGAYGVTRREWRVLAVLAARGPLLSTALAREVQLDPARTSRAVSTLVTKKLINRELLPHDQRKVRLTLTEAGADLYATFFPQVVQINQDILSVLTPAEIVLLENLLARLHTHTADLVAGMDMPKANRRRSSSTPST